jgi:hypothetical protein
MDQRATSESLFFSGCAFFILLMLCSISHAGGMGSAGGDYSAPTGPVSSSEETALLERKNDNVSLAGAVLGLRGSF